MYDDVGEHIGREGRKNRKEATKTRNEKIEDAPMRSLPRPVPFERAGSQGPSPASQGALLDALLCPPVRAKGCSPAPDLVMKIAGYHQEADTMSASMSVSSHRALRPPTSSSTQRDRSSSPVCVA